MKFAFIDCEKADIKACKIPQDWQDKPSKLRQKDQDARWTVKFSKAKVDANGQTHKRDIAIPTFGYKNHIAIDKRHGYIRNYTTTPASAYDGAQLKHVLRKDNTASKVWADTAYRSNDNEKWLQDNGYFSDIHRKKPKGKPMSKATSKANHRRSKVRTKVEHVFAHIKGGAGLFIRTIGIKRAHLKIGMANLVYNLKRYVWHEAKANA